MFMQLSLASRISLGISILIMLVFFSIQTAVVLGYFDISYNIALFGWSAVITFMPFFFFVVVEFIRKVKYKFQSIDDTLKAINQSNALVEFELDGTIISCNDIFCNVTGYSKKELIGKNHSSLVSLDISESYQYITFWDKLKRGHSQNGEFRRIGKGGREFWIYGNYNPIKDPYGETYRVLKIASDITAKKEIELEVSKKNTYLEHAAKILRHDMHSGINTYIPRGLSSLKRRLKPEQIKDLKIESPLKMIQEGLIHTQKVYKGVKEFTNLVKKDAQLDMEEVNLKDILVNYLGSTSYYKQVVIDDLPMCNVNEALFCTAIDNLIRNGLKYNDSATKVVRIYMEEKSSLVIEDNGRGMTQEEFTELSQPYTRREGQKEGGSGLGLNICIAIMEEHGYKVTAEKLEQGTKLRIKLK
jgi:PAS domain S-box-containing protein